MAAWSVAALARAVRFVASLVSEAWFVAALVSERAPRSNQLLRHREGIVVEDTQLSCVIY